MEKKFVSHDIAVALKELDFDKPCLAGFSCLYNEIDPDYETTFETTKEFYQIIDEEICIGKHYGYHRIDLLAPLWQDVIDWFEIKYNITIDTSAAECDDGESGDGPMFEYYIQDWRNLKRICYNIQYTTRKEALTEAILKTIELIKEK